MCGGRSKDELLPIRGAGSLYSVAGKKKLHDGSNRYAARPPASRAEMGPEREPFPPRAAKMARPGPRDCKSDELTARRSRFVCRRSGSYSKTQRQPSTPQPSRAAARLGEATEAPNALLQLCRQPICGTFPAQRLANDGWLPRQLDPSIVSRASLSVPSRPLGSTQMTPASQLYEERARRPPGPWIHHLPPSLLPGGPLARLLRLSLSLARWPSWCCCKAEASQMDQKGAGR